MGRGQRDDLITTSLKKLINDCKVNKEIGEKLKENRLLTQDYLNDKYASMSLS